MKNGVPLPVWIHDIQHPGVLAHMGIRGEQIFVPVIVEVERAHSPAAHPAREKADSHLVIRRREEAFPLV